MDFGNGIIPSTNECFGNSIIHNLKYVLPQNKYFNKISNKIAQELQEVGVHNYYEFIIASWNNINWVYNLFINREERTLLFVISVYSLYLTSIGDIDKALDPMQWDYELINDWKW